MSDPAAARRILEALRQRALARAADLRRAFDALVEATEGSNVDDEHDPEGTTIAFERSQLSAALDRAAAEVAEVDAALDPGRRGDVRPVRGLRRPDPGGPPHRPPDRDPLPDLRGPGADAPRPRLGPTPKTTA